MATENLRLFGNRPVARYAKKPGVTVDWQTPEAPRPLMAGALQTLSLQQEGGFEDRHAG